MKTTKQPTRATKGSKPEPTTGQKVKAQLWGFFTGYFSEKVEDIQLGIVLVLVIIWLFAQIVRLILQNWAL